MYLARELETQIRAYLTGAVSLLDLQDWLAAHVEAVAASETSEFQRIAGRTWLLIAEWLNGSREEDSIRDELTRVVAQVTQELGPAGIPSAKEVVAE